MAFRERRLPIAIAASELQVLGVNDLMDQDVRLVCDNFLQAGDALREQSVAAVLPDYLNVGAASIAFLRVHVPSIDARRFCFRLAWNPRLIRLNPHASRRRDFLIKAVSERMGRVAAY